MRWQERYSGVFAPKLPPASSILPAPPRPWSYVITLPNRHPFVYNPYVVCARLTMYRLAPNTDDAALLLVWKVFARFSIFFAIFGCEELLFPVPVSVFQYRFRLVVWTPLPINTPSNHLRHLWHQHGIGHRLYVSELRASISCDCLRFGICHIIARQKTRPSAPRNHNRTISTAFHFGKASSRR